MRQNGEKARRFVELTHHSTNIRVKSLLKKGFLVFTQTAPVIRSGFRHTLDCDRRRFQPRPIFCYQTSHLNERKTALKCI